jgi:alpha-glucosidase
MAGTRWWQTAVIYQIYPRSFQDSGRDGVGDLPGIIRRLPYLAELGVDAVWLSPIFRSPMADFGYDISDYTDIDPLFGRLAEFDALIEASHRLGIRVILDLVPNHTSDRHPWFVESRASRTSRKRDWYIWRDPGPDGGPPNNWLSEFGGSAWRVDPATGQYYYHAFLAEQPDLNWRNPAVRDAVHDVMRFWLVRGVDGFRVDVIWHLLKDDQFRDNPDNLQYRPDQLPQKRLIPIYTEDLPGVQDIIAGLRSVIDEFADRLLIGEIYLPIGRLVAYYGEHLRGVQLPFNFALLETEWHARAIAKLVSEYEAALPPGGWPNWVLGNHDRPRIASRVGRPQARVAAMLLLTLRGTPTLYYGDEIGMNQVAIPPDRVRDPLEKNVPGRGLGRDGARTPMQWDAGRFAGFSEVEPWLPIADDADMFNLTNERDDRSSLFNLYLKLIRLRRTHRALQLGAYRAVEASGDVMLYAREADNDRIFVALNMSGSRCTVRSARLHGQVLLSTDGTRDSEPIRDAIELRADEGLIIGVSPDADIPAAVEIT